MGSLRIPIAIIILGSALTATAQPNPFGCHYFRNAPRPAALSAAERDGIQDIIARSDTFDIVHYEIDLDVTDLQFPDEHFDMIICSHVLEHVPDDRKAMRELSRVLKKGGTGLVLSPMREDWETTREDPSITDPEERYRLYGKFDHVRYYGRDYVDRLKEAGFQVEVIDPWAKTSYEDRFRFGISDEKLYVVGK